MTKKTKKQPPSKTIAILVTTEYKGVFFARAPRNIDLSARTLKGLTDCRMAINWMNGKGVMGLAQDGPDDKCLVSSSANIRALHCVTGVFDVTDAAAAKWDAWVKK